MMVEPGPASMSSLPDLPASERPWFHEAFDHAYNELYAHRDEDEARQCVDLMERLWSQHATDRGGRQGPLLDLCCGAGRHSAQARARGFCVVSLDLSTDLLQSGVERDAELLAVRADMRVLPFADGAFAGMLNFFTSFGYFSSDEENLDTAIEMARVIEPGGLLLWDHINPDWLRSHLVAESRRQIAGGIWALERRRIDPESRRVEKTIELHTPGDGPAGQHELVRRYRESVRLYSPLHAVSLFHRAGFDVLERLGDYQAGSFTAASPRQILLLRRR